MIQQQLDQLSTIGRCEYEKTCGLIVRLFDESATAYQELLSSGQTQSNSVPVTVQEGQSDVQEGQSRMPVTVTSSDRRSLISTLYIYV